MVTRMMIALIAGTSALLEASPALAKWVAIGEDPKGDRYHISEESITELSQDIVIFDTLVQHAQPQANGAVATIDRFVADCGTGAVSNVAWTTFDGNQQILDAQALPRLETTNAPSGSVMAVELEFACTAIGAANREQ